MASEISAPISRPRHGVLRAAYGIHLGLLMVALSAVLSRPPAGLGAKNAAVLVLVGLALLAWAWAERGNEGASAGLRVTTALGAALLLGLARSPKLTAYLGLPAGGPWDHAPVTLGTVGVLLAFLCWLVILAGGVKHFRPAPLEQAVRTAFLLVTVLSVVYLFILRPLYSVSAEDLGTWVLVIRAVTMAALLLPVLGATGGPLVKRWPALYLGAALILAAALGLAHGGGGLP